MNKFYIYLIDVFIECLRKTISKIDDKILPGKLFFNSVLIFKKLLETTFNKNKIDIKTDLPNFQNQINNLIKNLGQNIMTDNEFFKSIFIFPNILSLIQGKSVVNQYLTYGNNSVIIIIN